MRITDRQITTEEQQGQITFETGNTVRLTIGTTGAIGFFGGTAVAVQSTTATTGTFTAGTGTTSVSGSSWVGNVGTKSYSVSDIVTALKNYGLLTS